MVKQRDGWLSREISSFLRKMGGYVESWLFNQRDAWFSGEVGS